MSDGRFLIVPPAGKSLSKPPSWVDRQDLLSSLLRQPLLVEEEDLDADRGRLPIWWWWLW